MSRRYTLLVLAIAFAGCSKGTNENLVPAEGTVKLDGKPLSGATLLFIPFDGTSRQSCSARTDASGKFRLAMLDLKKEGAAPGGYRVIISKKVNPDGSDFVPKPDEDPMLAAYKELLPPRYTDEAQSTLEVTIPDAGTTNIELKLTSKAR
jgi:hypothetical protein